MRDILFLKCSKSIQADDIVDLLSAHSIPIQICPNKDEINSTEDTNKFTIFVPHPDYQKSISLISTFAEIYSLDYPICPKCKSHNVSYQIHRQQFGGLLILIGLSALLLPCIYYFEVIEFGFRTYFFDILSFGLGIIGIVLLFLSYYVFKKFKCKDCGHSFHSIDK